MAAAFENVYSGDEYIYRFSPSQNCDAVYSSIKKCFEESSSLKTQNYQKTFSFPNQYFNRFNPDDCTNIKILKLSLHDDKTALVFERSTYSTSSPYTVKIDKNENKIFVKQPLC